MEGEITDETLRNTSGPDCGRTRPEQLFHKCAVVIIMDYEAIWTGHSLCMLYIQSFERTTLNIKISNHD